MIQKRSVKSLSEIIYLKFFCQTYNSIALIYIDCAEIPHDVRASSQGSRLSIKEQSQTLCLILYVSYDEWTIDEYDCDDKAIKICQYLGKNSNFIIISIFVKLTASMYQLLTRA